MVSIRKDLEFENQDTAEQFLQEQFLGKVVTVTYTDDEDDERSHSGKVDKLVFDTVTKHKGVILFFVDKRITVPKDEAFQRIKILN
jgi:uncharacterized glyoxalase superfamily protein PhnB